MYFKFAILLFIISCTRMEENIQLSEFGSDSYSLSWDGKSSNMKVNLVYTISSEITEFTFGEPDFGGQVDIIKILKNVNSNDGEKVEIDVKNRKIRIYHSKKNKLKKRSLNYEINGAIRSGESFINQMFRPVILENSFYMSSYFFLLSRYFNNNQTVSIRWINYPENLTYMNTIRPNTKNPRETILLTKEELDKNIMLIIFGDYKIRNYPSSTGTNYQLLYNPNDGQNNIQELASPFFTSFFPSMGKYWNESMGENYTLSLIPFIRNTIDDKGYSGIGIGNGFLMKYFDVINSFGIHTIAHETSHYWIGGKLSFIGDNPYENQWFTEGFNDYVTLSLLASSIIYNTNEDFLTELERKQLSYLGSC